ncbi:Arc family DNA-binding protein, partial [Mesorhizobium sp. M7A.T.Ca.TU.009.02.1.1]
MPDPTFHARLPASLLKRLKIAAAEEGRSMNAEIVERLVKSFGLTAVERDQL